MSTTKAKNQNVNKDLSCLRCRKKKARCSKTRPTCARCERSNHPCEYPDAPPNLTDLSKKVLDLYDSLRDLEGELLFKYMQPPTADQDSTVNNDLLDNDDPVPSVETTNSTTTPTHQRQPSSPSAMNQGNSSLTTTTTIAGFNAPPSPSENQDIDWSMSYLADGISIQTSTHTVSDFTYFIDKLTQQLFRDFGTDSTLSTYWDLDASTHGSGLMADNEMDNDDDDDLDEDDYLVTVPIFDTTLFLHPLSLSSSAASPSPLSINPAFPSALPTLLPTLLQYVYRHLKYIDDTTLMTSSTVHHHVTPLLHQLISFLPAQDNDISRNAQQDPLTTLYIMTASLTCTTFFSNSKKNDTDPVIGQPPWTPLDGYLYAKTLLIDTVLQITPTHGVCVSALLLLWIQIHSYSGDESPHTLLDLLWRMVGSGLLLWHHDRTMTPETETIGAALVYLDTYITTFSSQQQPQEQQQRQQRPSHLCHDIGLTLRERLSASLSLSKTKGGAQQQKRGCMLLESQLMWFLSQVLGLFYTCNSSNSIVKVENGEDAKVKVRKVDVDEVLTLVRDLEQWEQQLPSWATCDTTTSSKTTTTTADDTGMKMMIDQLHLTLHIIKILLFRPFCTAFNQHGIEQTYTKTTFLDLSMHSASRLATCVNRMKNNDGNFGSNKGDDNGDGWLLVAYRLIRDVVERVRTTFDDDQDIKIQLDAIIHRIDT